MKIVNYNFNLDLSPIVLWQYQDAPRIKGMIANQQKFVDENITAFWESWNKDIMNLQTCNTFGLSVWGRILQTARPTYLQDGQSVEYTDEQYRLVLQARIFLLTFDGSAKALNHFFKILFPDLMVQIVDNYDMTVDINIISDVTPDVRTVLTDSLFLPRPSGVEYRLNFGVDYETTFGFEGMTETVGFEQGTFIN